jgi:hypothetical protein
MCVMCVLRVCSYIKVSSRYVENKSLIWLSELGVGRSNRVRSQSVFCFVIFEDTNAAELSMGYSPTLVETSILCT